MTVAVAVALARRRRRRPRRRARAPPSRGRGARRYDPAADARTERQHHEIATSPTGAEPPLGERSRIAVVLDAGPAGRNARARAREVDVVRAAGLSPAARARAPVEVRAARRSRSPATPASSSVLDRRRRCRRAPPPACPSGVATSFVRADRAVTVDDAGEDLRPAEVDADDEFFMHRAATISAPHARPGEALPRLSGRPGQGQGPAASAGTAAREARRRRRRNAPPRRPPRRLRWGRGRARARRAPAARVVWGVGSYFALSNGIGTRTTACPPSVAHAADDARRPAHLDTDDDPRARHRRRRASRPRLAPHPTRSCSSTPIRASTGSRSSPSRAISGSRSPATAPARSTPRSSWAARRSR